MSVSGTGNVFRDIGLPLPDLHLAKADLVIALVRIVEERRLSPGAAATLAGTSPWLMRRMAEGRFTDVPTARIQATIDRLDRRQNTYRP